MDVFVVSSVGLSLLNLIVLICDHLISIILGIFLCTGCGLREWTAGTENSVRLYPVLVFAALTKTVIKVLVLKYDSIISSSLTI